MPQKAKPTRPRSPRHAFSIQEQLIGKLDRGAFGKLLDSLNKAARPQGSRRRTKRPA